MSTPTRKPAVLPDVRAMRATLLTGAAAFAVLMAITLLLLYTSVFAGTVGGVGIAYLVGFVDFIAVLAVAGVYCLRQNRADDEADAQAARTEGRAL